MEAPDQPKGYDPTLASYWLDSLAPHNVDPTALLVEPALVIEDTLAQPVFAALEFFLVRIYSSQGYEIVGLERAVVLGEFETPPGWAMVRAMVTIREIDVLVSAE